MSDIVILVDDEAAVRTALSQTLDLAGISVETAAGVDEALAKLSADWPGAVVTDMRMPEKSGSDLLEAVRGIDPDIPVIVLTGHGDIPMAVGAMSAGAYDFLEKPCSPEKLVDVVQRACEKRRLVSEIRRLRDRLALAEAGALTANILGEAAATRRYRAELGRLAHTDLDVLILGETGAGKELGARAIHAQSDRANGPFVAVNCGAIPGELAGSELFGHEKGAFTGATARRIGKFEQANGGTILLDEIESMPLDLQVKLLRILQERELERLGGNTSVPLDIRVVAASKADLQAEAAAGRFREDLYFRLEVGKIRIPAMRERSEDAPLLFRAFVDAAAGRRGVEPPRLTPGEDAALVAHSWPGNVREIKNAAERFAMGLGLVIGDAPMGGEATRSLPDRVNAFEKAAIESALAETGGQVVACCALLGLPRKTVYDKLRKHDIDPERFRS